MLSQPKPTPMRVSINIYYAWVDKQPLHFDIRVLCPMAWTEVKGSHIFDMN